MADKKKPKEAPEIPETIQEEVATAASSEGAGDTVAAEETPAPAEEHVADAEEAPTTPAAEPVAEETPAPVEEPVADDPVADAEEAPATPAAKPAAPATREVQLPPKERRIARRAANAPAARGPVTPEQRDEERRVRRTQRAKVRRTYRARAKTKAAERRAAEPTPEPSHAPEHGPGRAKERQGIVVSDKADKTIVVRVDITRRHQRYGKIMRTSSKLHVHDESNDAGTGDTVRVQECRPMSRSKRWRLTEVLEKAK